MACRHVARSVRSRAFVTSAAPAQSGRGDVAPSSTPAPPQQPPVGIVMLNMGGPSSLEGSVDGVQPFLQRLFMDKEIIMLGPLQKWLGPYIANKRSPRIREQYSQIGGKSPIGDWTRLQGQRLEDELNAVVSAAKAAPTPTPASAASTSPAFKHYVAFRYAPPLTEETLLAMAADGVTRAVAFSQYPHFSCTTVGSSMNHLWRESIRLGLEKRFTWSLIDRWPTHPTFIKAVARCVATGLSRFPLAVRDKVVIMFTAHSVPMLVVNRGDPYVQEISATVSAVMDVLRSPGAGGVTPCRDPTGKDQLAGDGAAIPAVRSPYVLAWQSKVGFLPWMGPPTASVLAGLGRQGHQYVLAVPIAFTSDHVETLFEIDIEYAEDAHKAGILQFERAPSLNGEPLLTAAQAELVRDHLAGGHVSSPQYPLNCAGCVNPACRSVLNPVGEDGRTPGAYAKLRDSYTPGGCGAIPGSPWPTAEETVRLKALGTEPNK